MVPRMRYRRRLCYNTASNRRRISKTPGGKIVYLYPKKPGTVPKCGDCKRKLCGIAFARPRERGSMSRRLKIVTRTYGGTRCGRCVKDRIIRAFLLEEQKIVAKVLKAQQVAGKGGKS